MAFLGSVTSADVQRRFCIDVLRPGLSVRGLVDAELAGMRRVTSASTRWPVTDFVLGIVCGGALTGAVWLWVDNYRGWKRFAKTLRK